MTTATAAQDFPALADPYRRELLAHCYRMLGSVHDAEDLVQETYLRAWRAYDKFEGRSSLRTWLHRIATTACLTALESRGKRPLPAGLGSDSDPADGLAQRPELPWLEPMPDAMVESEDADPATVVTNRADIRLAFIAALQHLPARQRAVLLLREVLKWRAAEVADALGTTTAAVNSSLQRARAQLEHLTADDATLAEPTERERRDMLDRYVAAFEAKDVPAIVKLFTADAVYEMPPYTTWFRGPARIAGHLATTCPAGPGDLRMLPTVANGQPAFGAYLRAGDGAFRPFHLQVLTMTAEGITHFAGFFDTRLFTTFGLPDVVYGTVPAE